MKKDRENNYSITEGVIWKQLLIFFFPILLGTFFQQLYNTSDAVIVGKFVGKQGLSAVGGSTGTLINLLIGFFVGMSSGATVIVSQYYGAKKEKELNDAVHTAMAMAIAGGILFMILGVLGAHLALKAMGTPEEVMPYSLIYIRIYFLGMIPNMIYNMGAGILRAVGDSKRPLYFLIVSCLFNILLDVLLVVIFKMGVLGAALATILSQLLSACMVCYVLIRTDAAYQMRFKKIKIYKPMLMKIIKIGLPAGLQSMMYNVANVVIQSYVNAFGTNMIAAWTAYSKIDGLFWMTMGAFGVSITTFVGQNYGAKKQDRVRQGVKVCMGMAMIGAIFLSVTLYFTGQYVYGLFTDDPLVIKAGVELLKFLVPTYFTYVCIEILAGALRGMGDSILPMILTCVGVCGLRIAWLLIAVPIWPTIQTVAFSYPLSWVITSILFVIYYKHFWKRKALIKWGKTCSVIQ